MAAADLQRLLAERECERLQIRYALAADRGDAEGFAALFTADARIVIPEYPPFVGHSAIHASLVALAGLRITMLHIVTNQLVTVTGPDTAEGICYLTVFDNPDDADAAGLRGVRPASTVGVCEDRFVRTGDGWRIQEHRLTRIFTSRAGTPVSGTGAGSTNLAAGATHGDR